MRRWVDQVRVDVDGNPVACDCRYCGSWRRRSGWESRFFIEIEDQDPTRQGLVPALLVPPSLHLFLIPQPWIALWISWVTSEARQLLREMHMVEAIVFHRLVVEPRTITALPLGAADHAELCVAPTRHVVASFLQLDRCRAVETPLPSLLLCDLREPRRGFVLGAFAPRVPPAVTGAAHLRAASFAVSVLAAAARAARSINMDMRGLDPFAATARRAVDAVLGGVFLIFAVPGLLELEVEETFDVLERDVVGGAAFGRHVLRVGDR